MNITILERVKYAGRYLVVHQTYNDIDDTEARRLIDSGAAQEADPSIAGVSVHSQPQKPGTPAFDAKKDGYKAEAKLTEKQKKDLEEKGKAVNPDTGEEIAKDETPVNSKSADTTPEPKEKVEVLGENGQPLTEEEIAAREKAAAAGAQETPSTPEALNNSGQAVPPKE